MAMCKIGCGGIKVEKIEKWPNSKTWLELIFTLPVYAFSEKAEDKNIQVRVISTSAPRRNLVKQRRRKRFFPAVEMTLE